MSNIPCIGTLSDGKLCEKRAGKSGYCGDCDPDKRAKAAKAASDERKKEAKRKLEKEQREEQAREIFQQDLKNMIAECRTLEDLRKLELKIIGAIIDGTIDDPRVGSPIAQMLKHQEQLISRGRAEDEDLKPHERDRAIERAKRMSPEEMLGLIGDIAHGMKQLYRQAKIEISEPETLTITAREVPDES